MIQNPSHSAARGYIDRVMYIHYYLLMNYFGPVSEVRTQIYLPRVLHEAVKKTASKRGVSMGQVIREAVEAKVEVKHAKTSKAKQWQQFMKYAGFIKGKPKLQSTDNMGALWAEDIYTTMMKNRSKE